MSQKWSPEMLTLEQLCPAAVAQVGAGPKAAKRIAVVFLPSKAAVVYLPKLIPHISCWSLSTGLELSTSPTDIYGYFLLLSVFCLYFTVHSQFLEHQQIYF